MKQYFIATFDNEFDLKEAATAYREQNLKILDAFTPYAVHGLDKAMGLKPSRLTKVCFLFGLTGLIFALLGQYWTSAVSWPINIGGKPWNSLPAFMPVAFEVTILFAGLGTVFTLLVIARLRPGKVPKQFSTRVSDDHFLIVLTENKGALNEKLAESISREHNAIEWRLGEEIK